MEILTTGFVYTIEHVGVDGKIKSVEQVHNLIPNDGLNYFLRTAFRGGSAYSTWYLGVYGASRTPVQHDTMASFIANCDEVTTYNGTTRQALSFPDPVAGVISTVLDPNVLVFPSAATVRGGFIASGSAKGSADGLLISAVLFPSPKVLSAGESLRIPVGFSLVTM